MFVLVVLKKAVEYKLVPREKGRKNRIFRNDYGHSFSHNYLKEQLSIDLLTQMMPMSPTFMEISLWQNGNK
jgi:hypothetical protein